MNNEYTIINFYFLLRKLKESELKSIEDRANERIEELVARRVEEELERRRDEIEAEVLKRVEEAKLIMEKQMMEELERRKQEQIAETERREVRISQLLRAFVANLQLTPTGATCRTRAPAL